jgi:hypothetical protein
VCCAPIVICCAWGFVREFISLVLSLLLLLLWLIYAPPRALLCRLFPRLRGILPSPYLPGCDEYPRYTEKYIGDFSGGDGGG